MWCSHGPFKVYFFTKAPSWLTRYGLSTKKPAIHEAPGCFITQPMLLKGTPARALLPHKTFARWHRRTVLNSFRAIEKTVSLPLGFLPIGRNRIIFNRSLNPKFIKVFGIPQPVTVEVDIWLMGFKVIKKVFCTGFADYWCSDLPTQLAGPFVKWLDRYVVWRLQLGATFMRFRDEHRTASIFTDDQVNKKLRSGDLIVGISEASQAKHTIRLSIPAAKFCKHFSPKPWKRVS